MSSDIVFTEWDGNMSWAKDVKVHEWNNLKLYNMSYVLQ